jgi:ABC-type proline/glycine betaine transport system substrate-binding protein
MDGEWILSAVAPAVFEAVNFQADDQDEAERNAKGWVEANADHVLTWMEDD